MEIRMDRERLRQLRRAGSLSQEALAAVSGLHPRTVQRIEATGIASVQSARSLARALNVEVADIELVSGVSPDKDDMFRAAARVLQGVGAAFLWVAVSALVWVADGEPGALSAAVSILGFASLCAGLVALAEGNRRISLLR